MKFGEKIKNARKLRKMTQNALAGDKITRNMISRIESDKATPSLDTLVYIAEKLSLPVSYLLSEDENLFFFEKKERIKSIYSAYSVKDFAYCVKRIKTFSEVDDELAFIMVSAAFEMGKKHLLNGSLKTALNHFALCEEYAQKTVFDTRHILAVLGMYRALATNIQSPLLEFDYESYISGLYDVFDYEVYKYMMQDYSYAYTDESIKQHIAAKALMKDRNYDEALVALLTAAEYINSTRYNAFLIFGIYSDIETCYRQIRDFENAYKYSSKRLSMLEGFKS